ncbi:MAG TPA: TonB-dependent receptor, partial [Steroidobacteraceae bacterium]|nr:TonB-dependent receptor [Steroidobacteraceae bacterium]
GLDLGASVLWTSPALPFGGAHTLSLGSDARRIDGTTRETLPPPTTPPPGDPTVQRDAAGQQQLYGVFLQELYDYSAALSASLALRYDQWQNLSAWRRTTAYSGAVTDTTFPDRSDGEFSPKFAVRMRINDWLTARATAYRAFRAPTLDELYRPFQAGTVRTDANPYLGPETVRGAEAGLDLGGSTRLGARLTAFWNDLENPILNVSTGPNTAQRRNLGHARIQGLEFEARWALAPNWSMEAAGTLAPTEVTEAPGEPQLLGKQLPQSPREVGRVSLSYDRPGRMNADLAVRYIGRQYENDINTLPIGSVVLTDLHAGWHLTSHLDLYVAVENLFNEAYLVGRAGVDTIGQPRFVHGGFRLRLGSPPAN